MTDRELLEAAAKAAGIDITIMALSGPNIISGSDAGKLWNPLTDDGDALGLAVKLGLAVSVEFRVGSTAVLWGPPMGTVREFHGEDPHAATRRAIVRAAAAIGDAM
jgi:hypothetical protein